MLFQFILYNECVLAHPILPATYATTCFQKPIFILKFKIIGIVFELIEMRVLAYYYYCYIMTN